MSLARQIGLLTALTLLLGMLVKGAKIEERKAVSQPCGVNKYGNTKGKIVGGGDVQKDEYPWRVALFKNTSNALKLTCGGTLITPSIILTAAHCARSSSTSSEEKPKMRQLFAAVGYTNIAGLSFTHVTKIARHVIHENFTDGISYGSSFKNDIALLFLDKPVKLSDSVQLSCLPFNQKPLIFGRSTATASGWGKLNQGGEGSSQLKDVTLPLVSYEYCWIRFFFSVGLLLTDSTMCAYSPGVDTCQGDSGGGLDLKGPDNRMYTVGITSWGFGCARWGNPGVYTKVEDYLDWIMNNTLGSSFWGQDSHSPGRGINSNLS